MGEWLETWSPQSPSHCGRQDPCKQLYFLQPNLPFEREFLLAQNITTRWLQQQNQKAMTLNIIWCKHKTHLKYCNLFTSKGTTGLQVEQMCSILRQNTHATFVHRLHWRTRHDPHANSVHQDSHLFAAFDFLNVGTSGMAQDKEALYCNLMLIFMWLSNACAHSVQKAEVVLYSGLKELLQVCSTQGPRKQTYTLNPRPVFILYLAPNHSFLTARLLFTLSHRSRPQSTTASNSQ